MGKGKKADPAKIAAKKAKAAAKQEKSAIKASKKDLKTLGTNEEDIETILAEFQEKEKARTTVTVTPCSQPSPRSNFSLTALSNNEFLLFGGEFCDGEGTTVFNELYRWNIDKNEWKMVESLNTPPPRCSHQAVHFKDKVYIFGGEYATLDQFHHYRDMWALDLKTNIWEEIPPSKDGPSARSGHRMVVWRNCILLFGGFYEALREVRWYDDLYIFSFTERKWMQVPPKPYVQAPRARSGFLMTVHPSDDAIFVFGGYSKEKVTASGGSGSGTKKSEGKIHTDMWMLSLKGVISGGKSGGGGTSRLDLGKMSWQKLSNKGSPPSIRCGASMTSYKNKGIYFGGVNDSEGPRHTIISTFYNDLYAFDFERKRWYQLGLKAPKADKKSRNKKKKRALKLMDDEAKDGDDSSDEGDDDSSDDEDDEEDEELVLQKRLERENENCFGYIDDDGNIVYVKMEDEEHEDAKDVGGCEEKDDMESAAFVNVPEPEQNPDGDWVNVSEVDVALIETEASVESSKMRKLTTSDEIEIIAPLTAESLNASEVGNMSEKESSSGVKFADMTGVECSQLQRYFIENTAVPVPRINSSLVIRGCSLFVYGGLTEIGDVEVTLDDCWSLDLNKRDQWKRVLPGTMSEMIWKGEDDLGSEMTGETGSDFDCSDDSDTDEDDEDYNEGDGDKKSVKKKKSKDKEKGLTKSSRRAGEATGVRAELQLLKSQLPMDGEDDRQYPISVPNDRGEVGYRVEALKEFYSRTSSFWKQSAIDAWKEQKVVAGVVSMNMRSNDDQVEAAISERQKGANDEVQSTTASSARETLSNLASLSGQESLSDKEIKKIAFSLCQERYEDVLETSVQLVELESALGEETSGRHDRRGKKSEKTGKKR